MWDTDETNTKCIMIQTLKYKKKRGLLTRYILIVYLRQLRGFKLHIIFEIKTLTKKMQQKKERIVTHSTRARARAIH